MAMDIFSFENISSYAKKKFNAISNSAKTIFFIFIILFLGAFISSRWIDTQSFLGRMSNAKVKFPWSTQPIPQPKQKPNPLLACSTQRLSNTCPSYISPLSNISLSPTSLSCPDYFRWIHEDLRPWTTTGITREMVEQAAPNAAFRLTIVDSRPYIYHYHNVFQTRDVFTIWGIIQLLRRYPGLVPDLDMMFNCEDMPVIHPINGHSPPPLFRYCKDDTTVDIIFPDWSFWGWPEVNIRPWEELSKELKEVSERIPWSAREPYAYWKGNPDVAETRSDLMKCNLTDKNDWEARVFRVQWDEEGRQQFKSSNLVDQCNYKYKVYIEGRAWSVSEKYILGCDSPTLYVETKFQDFVSRGLRPGLHYWPISQNDKCQAIKQAVQWGQAHPAKMQSLGKKGSNFIHNELQMNYIYDYMLHLLTEYSKLLTFKPTKPDNSIDLCFQSLLCSSQGKVREFLLESMVSASTPRRGDAEPCAMPSPFESSELKEILMEKTGAGTKKIVESLLMERNAGERVFVGFSFLVFLGLFLSLYFEMFV